MAALAALDASPIDDQSFAEAMAALGPYEHAPLLAVAVSGGPDSMALAWLANRWAHGHGGRAFAVIIDHGLRPEAADEAKTAAEQLRTSGIAAEVRRVTEAPPSAGVSAWAREQRYWLLRAVAAEHGALHLLLAHHQNDQAETVLLRLARGSGVKGLASMRDVTPGAAVRLLRPLLGFPKARVLATAQATGWTLADDPSNRAEKYARTRMRSALATAGGDVKRLASTAASLGQDDDAIEHAATALAVQAVCIMPVGVIRLDRAALAMAPISISARLLDRVIRMAAGAIGPLRRSRVERLLAEVRGGKSARRTCGGAVLDIKGNDILLWREAAKLPAPAPLNRLERNMWDNRFRLSLNAIQPVLADDLLIGPLGYQGLRTLEAKSRLSLKAILPNGFSQTLPRQVVAGLPVLTQAGRIVGLSTFEPVSISDRPNPLFCDIKPFHAQFAPPTPLTVASAC